MQLALRLIAIVSFIVAIVWVIQAGALEPEPILAFLTGLTTLALSFTNEKKESGESLNQRNRRVMLNHVEKFWVKGILEKSLHGAVLLELGIKEDPTAVNYPWRIKRESTNKTLPAGKSMLEIFEEIGLGRSLLILGAPGSGKTTIMLELARQLIERARNDETEPIPVVFNLSSWKEKQTLADWLAEQLNTIYYVPKKTAPTWVNDNRMLLLLDGLDEVKQDRRDKCVEAINQFRKENGLTSLIVCSRLKEYGEVNKKLALEGAITLQPLTAKQINAYFDRFGKSLAAVKQLLQKQSLTELAETPLMLSIMALAYKDRKAGELIASGNVAKQREHLFDTYIKRMFEHSARTINAPFSKQQTLHYLSRLADKMIEHNIITYQIEAMQPFWLAEESQRRIYRLFVVLIVVLIGGLIVWLLLGLSVRLTGGLDNEITIVDKLKWSWKESRIGLISGLSVWLGVGLSGGLTFGLISGLSVWLSVWLSVGLILGLIFGLSMGLMRGLIGEQIEETTRPGQRLTRALFNAVFVVISIVLILALMGGLSVWHIGGLLLGLMGGLMVALSIGGLAFIEHYSLRFVLARYDLLPQHLIPFLEHAVDLIFLRRVGGSYIFVHRLLMEHFAEMEV